MPSMRLLTATLCLALLAASPWNVCRSSRRVPISEPGPTGPTLENIYPDQGLLTLRFPNRDPEAYVYIHAIGQPPPDIVPKRFPIRIPLRLNQVYVVRATVHDDAGFNSEAFTLTPEHREKEIVIRLTETRSSGNYGFAKSELPIDTGFIPLNEPRGGEPRGRVVAESWTNVTWKIGPPFAYSAHCAELLVDEQGDVWYATGSYPGRSCPPKMDYRQQGRIEPAVFERMKSLRQDAAKGQLRAVCLPSYDGSSVISIHGRGIADLKGVTIAVGRSECERSTAPAATTIVAWIVALRWQVMRPKAQR